MVKAFFISMLLCLVSVSGQALQRQAYADEAVGEMEFYLRFLASEGSFLSTLNSKEKDQFDKIKTLTTALVQRQSLQLVYSDNPADFILNPGEPARSAKTTERLEDPIWINRQRLNDPNQNVSYLDLVQLLVHELGHKLGKYKDQAAVDSLAAKISSHLSQYLRKDPLILRASEGDRPLKEFFESLSLPKALSENNPDPTVFYVEKSGVYKIDYYFKKLFKDEERNRVIQLERLSSRLVQNVYLKSNFTVSKVFQTPQGPQLIHENSYLMEDFFFIIDGRVSQQPYDHGRLIWRRHSANFDFQVLGVKEVEKTKEAIKWDIEFTGKANPKNVHLLIGADNQDHPAACTIQSSSAQSTIARCTYPIPKVTSAFSVDAMQILVDGEVADLPEKIEIDLERDFRVRYDLSDQRPLKFETVQTNGQTRYELTMQSQFGFRGIIVRCLENQDYVLNSKVLGNLQKVVEQIYLGEAMPVKSRQQDQWVFSVTCGNNATISEILTTDGTGYTMSPRWNKTPR